MPEYLDRPKHPLNPTVADMADRKGTLKSCGHAPDYRCCCMAHEDADQDQTDCVDELTMNPGYRLCRAYSRELHGDD